MKCHFSNLGATCARAITGKGTLDATTRNNKLSYCAFRAKLKREIRVNFSNFGCQSFKQFFPFGFPIGIESNSATWCWMNQFQKQS